MATPMKISSLRAMEHSESPPHLSKGMGSCSYLRCAAEVITRTKSNECVRVFHHHPTDTQHQIAPSNNITSTHTDNLHKCTPPPTAADVSPTKSAENPTNTLPNESAKNNTIPNISCSNNSPSDRRQRRKEKKRRKKELRQQTKEVSMQTQAIRVTTTIFDSLPSSLMQQQSIVHVKPLIVLDLNGILCHRIRRKNLPTQPPSTNSLTTFRPSIGYISNTQVVPRSDLDEFLTLLHHNFCLAVWTSATRKTAKMLVRALFPKEVRERLVFVWHRNFCDLVEKSDFLESSASEKTDESSKVGWKDEGDGKKEEAPSYPKRKRKRRRENSTRLDKLCVVAEDDDGLESTSTTDDAAETIKSNETKAAPNKIISHDDLIAIKCLSKVWSSYPLWDATNTILLDDSPEKCPSQHRGNALHPPPICGTITCSVDENRKAVEGNVKSGSDKILDRGLCSNIDDDDLNQTTQRDFFQLLANHWAKPTSSPKDYLMTFLEDNAKGHNMGWEAALANNAEG